MAVDIKRKKMLFFKQAYHMFKTFFNFSMTIILNQHNSCIEKLSFPVGKKLNTALKITKVHAINQNVSRKKN